MKKLVLSIVVLAVITLQGFSQKMIVPASVYEDMKAHGKLTPDMEYIQVPDAHPTRPLNSIATNNDGVVRHPVQKNLVYHPNQPTTAGANCSCIATIDTSFHIAEITIGTPPDYRNDDGSTAQKTIPFTFCLYGNSYTSLYINNNGNVSFTGAYGTYTPVGFPSSAYVMVAPFWADVETTAPTSGLVYYKITPHYMIVQWDSVGYYNNHADKRNSFQVIITDGTDPILPAGNNIAFCYGSMEWTTGDASSGVNGFDGNPAEPATVGVNKGDGVTDYQLGEFGIPGVSYTGAYLPNINGVSWLNYQSLYFNSCASTNIPPIASGLNNCDTIKICGATDTLYLNALFLSPEAGQITNISLNLGGITNATVVSNNSGNVADAVVRVIAAPSNYGNNVITFTATDNGVPVGTTIVNVNVYIDTTGLSLFHPVITPSQAAFCQGDSVLLSITPTNYDSYLWNMGSSATSIEATTSGTYYCTTKLNGCYKSVSADITVHPTPTPLITGALFTCSGNTTVLHVDSTSIYTNYMWSNSSIIDSIIVNNGTFTVTVTDSFGCVGTSPPVTITNVSPIVTISNNSPVCPGTNVILTATANPAGGAIYTWSTAETSQSISVTTAGTYTVTLTYQNGCTADTTSIVTLFDSPHANFNETPPNTSPPGLVNFHDLSTVPSGTITAWVWNFGDSATSWHSGQNPSHTYLTDGTYHVTEAVQSSNGCWDTIRFDYIIVSDIQEPNVFTPNNPGANNVNQYLYFKNLEFFPGTKLTVYNRWGNKVYENGDYQNNWNGGAQTDGVYYYELSGTGLKATRYGFVQLLR